MAVPIPNQSARLLAGPQPAVGEQRVGPAVRVPIQSLADIVTARHAGRCMGATLGFTGTTLTIITSAISEVGRNIVEYAKEGEISIAPVGNGSARGLQIEARDRGPGIADLETAMRVGYSTSKSLGMGLPGARRLMDQFEISSAKGQGTTIRMTKWIG
jgi:serine/threonine-protein kinase RsbT